jgi:hypothetical protein
MRTGEDCEVEKSLERTDKSDSLISDKKGQLLSHKTQISIFKIPNTGYFKKK